jgi:hypothetical protein
LVSAVKPYKLDAALRIVLRTERAQIENDDWRDLIDFATRLVLAADDNALRHALFDTSPAKSHSFADQPASRRERRRLGRLPLALLAAGVALIAVGLNLLVGPSALLLRDLDAGLPALIGRVSLLIGLAACAWSLAQLAVSRSYRDSETGTTPRVLAVGFPLASSLVVVALSLSIAAATGPFAGGRLVIVETPSTRQAPPAYFQPPRSVTAASVATGQPDLARTSLLQSSAILIRDVSRLVTTSAQTGAASAVTTTSLAVTATPSPTTATQSGDSLPPNTAFARVSDSSSGDAVESRTSSVVSPASVQIHLAPPPTPRPAPTATPPRGLAASAPPGLPAPPPPVFPAPTTSAPTIRH